MIGSAADWANRSLGWGGIAVLCIAAVLALFIALLPLTWAAALILGSLVLVATLVRPQFGVLLLVPAVPFGSLAQVSVGVLTVSLTEALVALVLGAWLMRLVASQREIRISWPRLTLPLVVFLGVLVLSALQAVWLEYSAKEILKWIEVLAVYVLVANEMGGRWGKTLIFALLATGALVALHGIYQFLFQVGPEGFVLFDRFMRAHGTFAQPNPYGGYLGLTLPVAVGLVVAGVLRTGGRAGWQWTLWAAGTGLVMLVALIMSWSRGAWLGFGAALAAVGLAVAVRSGRAAMLGTVFAILAAYALLAGGLARVPPSIVQRFSDFIPYLGVMDVRGVEVTDANFAVLERMAHWQSAVGMWTDQPWLGVGIGNYAAVYSAYALPLWPLALGHAHNFYLNISAEAGALGLLAYLLLMGAALAEAWRAARWLSGWQWGVALGVLGVVVHLAVHSVFDNLYVHGMYLNVAILLGVIATNAQDQRLV